MERQFDLIIIGGGSAAFAAAIRANAIHKKTLLINDGLPLGGTCVNVGCVPSKFLIRAAESFYYASHTAFQGITPKVAELNFRQVILEKQKLVERMQHEKYLALKEDMEYVSFLEGSARFNSERTIIVSGTEYTSEKIIIATGTSTAIPEIPGLQNVRYCANDSLFELEELPESMIVLGGGYIGLEIAQAYARFGTKVTVIEGAGRILSQEAEDITTELTKHLEGEGIEIITAASVKEIGSIDGKTELIFERGVQQETVSATHLLVATGRKPNTENLNLEKSGVEMDERGFIKVNEKLRTSTSGIYAIGDVIGLPQFVYVAAMEGRVAVNNAFGILNQKVELPYLPWAVFTDPQVAGVGMDEFKARENGIPHEVTVLPLSEVPKCIVANDTRGFIKLIRNTKNDRLLGARIIAKDGSELTGELALAVKNKVTVNELASTLHTYLTLSEGIRLAAMSFRVDVKKMSCCVD